MSSGLLSSGLLSQIRTFTVGHLYFNPLDTIEPFKIEALSFAVSVNRGLYPWAREQLIVDFPSLHFVEALWHETGLLTYYSVEKHGKSALRYWSIYAFLRGRMEFNMRGRF